jgi:hypothetical protein
MDIATLKDFETAVWVQVPGFKIDFKDESKLHQVLGFLARPFNAGYMTSFTTTLGNTVAFPSRDFYERSPLSSFIVLAHEFVHLWDQKQGAWRFKLTYLFPQVLGLIPLLLYGILAWKSLWLLAVSVFVYLLACAVAPKSKILMSVVLALGLGGTLGLAWWLTGWKVLAFLGGLVFFGPWPAPGRVRLEQRGYAMSIAVPNWFGYEVSSIDITNHFTSGEYFFMSWSPAAMNAYYDSTREMIRSGALQGVPPYNIVRDFLYQRGLLP